MSDALPLFVYGTLLASADHPMGALLRDRATLIGAASIQARLYQIDDPEEPGNSYPGAVPSGYAEDRVHGDLFAIQDPDMFDVFDIYEACDPSRPVPHEFLRRTLPARLHTGEIRTAVSYLYAWDLSRACLIPSGRFTDKAPDVR